MPVGILWTSRRLQMRPEGLTGCCNRLFFVLSYFRDINLIIFMLSWCSDRPLGHAAARERVRGPMDTQAWLAGTPRHYCSVVEVAILADEVIRSVSFAAGGLCGGEITSPWCSAGAEIA